MSKKDKVIIELRKDEVESLRKACYNILFNNGFHIESSYLGNLNSVMKKLQENR
ncbi:hypothetical protein P7D52_10365 [Enterococcus dongliensis]|uniref:hypothetical protein n=1 Tax=Enterococcus dongliensis TaxID=2559925 RepID=UPI00288F9A60|nr:hypothetical protein [Enterococcus dongliensis]MDT2643189.1 hypothetical protein [Enterococcus dongliensis]